MTSFYTQAELSKIGFKYIGSNVKLSKKTSIYSSENISIGDNTRIDDYCVLSGNIDLGAYIHISAYSALYGGNGIIVENFATVSARNTLYSQNDDYSGEYMINSTIPSQYTNVTGNKIILKKHSIIAAGCIVLPGLYLDEGACIGSMSFVKENKVIPSWEIWAGIPAQYIKDRSDNVIQLSQNLKFNENPYILQALQCN